ncbi:hypothetical protein GIB67_033428 [Kingdonia uniflora]|uniref:Uncharacterized protein n=1 Tax=Kingdonia uniflora TaxID=39325 RepID=A0A7J7LU02_9MAGN|nr:hypothetical protein GIB67_033428 [Kingdonia uniflora]
MLSMATTPSPHSLFSHNTLHHHKHTISFSPLRSISTVQQQQDSPLSSDGPDAIKDEQKLPTSGCKACGKEEVESGCNGEGRIQGGIATVPGFGWWPIKAYRPCPGFVAYGGRYKRRGQSMDEVAWGRAEREISITSTGEVQPTDTR